ncbi:MAG: hypothetical protein V4520_05280 [Bacteroidota bacterium]
MIKNVVVFSGAPENIDYVGTVFHNLSKQQNNIDFITNIKWDRKEPTYGIALFLTPIKDIGLMCAIAQTHKVGFVSIYNELFRLNKQITNDEVFGATIFLDGEILEYKLDADDYKQITYDDNEGLYIFEDKKHDDFNEVFKILINRKLEKLAA